MTTISTEIPLVDLRRQHLHVGEETMEAFADILEGMRLFLGPNVQEFERAYAEYLEVEHAIGVADGTTALHLALLACGVRPGDEVITVSHTFFASAEAIVLAGATPVFVDIDPVTYTMDVEAAARAITPRTKALLPVHLYGRIADMEAVMALAEARNLRVVEDACQAHGARRDGRAAGTFGDAGCFSFYYSKNLGAYGEAGGVVTNDPDVAARLRMLRDHGSARRYHHDVVGVNGRLDEMQAAVLRIKLPFLDEWNDRRRDHAHQYNGRLADLPVQIPDAGSSDHVFHLYVIRTKKRDELQAHLDACGIHTGIHYPIPCHLQRATSTYGKGLGSLPVTEEFCGEILSLPMFPDLTAAEVDRVADTIEDFFSLHAN